MEFVPSLPTLFFFYLTFMKPLFVTECGSLFHEGSFCIAYLLRSSWWAGGYGCLTARLVKSELKPIKMSPVTCGRKLFKSSQGHELSAPRTHWVCKETVTVQGHLTARHIRVSGIQIITSHPPNPRDQGSYSRSLPPQSRLHYRRLACQPISLQKALSS